MDALKMRFPILKNKITIHRNNFSPLLMGCVIHHNLMNDMGIPLPNDTEISTEYPNTALAQDVVDGNDDWDGVTEYLRTR